MTNRLAIYIGVAVVLAMGLDMLLFDWTYSLFWARKLYEFIEYLAFWR